MNRPVWLLTIALLAGCGDEGAEEIAPSSWGYRPSTSHAEDQRAVAPLKPITGLDARKIALGDRLFHDASLSGNDIACATCHVLANGGDDGKPRSIGASGRPAKRNAPTVFNAALHFRQFWDGRAATLEEQMDGPVAHADEMGTSWPDVIARVAADPAYVSSFTTLYGASPTEATVKDAIATFERTLVTTGARFDAFLDGDDGALEPLEKQGWALFRSYGCISCHQGVAVGGNMFQVFGVFGNPYEEQDDDARTDLGRFDVTGKDEDRFVFKVPSLRNVAVTGPYFHDGTVSRLEDAIRLMLRYQLGREPHDDDVEALEAFLGTLTGTYDGKPIG